MKAGYTIIPIMYPANLAGVPDALIFFCSFSSIKGRKGGLKTRKGDPETPESIRDSTKPIPARP